MMKLSSIAKYTSISKMIFPSLWSHRLILCYQIRHIEQIWGNGLRIIWKKLRNRKKDLRNYREEIGSWEKNTKNEIMSMINIYFLLSLIIKAKLKKYKFYVNILLIFRILKWCNIVLKIIYISSSELRFFSKFNKSQTNKT